MLMPEISVTDEQYDQLERIREDVEAAFVDTYGRAHVEDAVEYLLDTYTPPTERGNDHSHEIIAMAEYSALQGVAANVSEVPGSGIDADELRGQLISELGPDELATRLHTVQTESDDESSTDASQPSTADQQSEADDSSSNTDKTESKEDTSELLSAANVLLEKYQSKWSRKRTGDEPYAVELPDGTSVSARTKDDVRQLLFKHYG